MSYLSNELDTITENEVLLTSNRINLYSLDLFTDEMDGRQGIIDLSIALYPKQSEDDSDHVYICHFLHISDHAVVT